MKEEVLRALRHSGQISGEEIGRALGISRTAIWKCIKGLRSDGYKIESAPSKGYAFVSAPDRVLPGEILEGLRTRVLGREITYHLEVSSTQDLAKSLAMRGADEGTTVLAEKQSGGYGRIGRKWSSLPGSISLSVILRPAIHPSEAPKFSIIAGVAVAGAIEKITNLKPKLKWPNDIMVGGKKAGGILTEMTAEIDRVNYIVIGIGINVNTAKSLIPENIREIATSLKVQGGKEVSRVRLVQSILENLESLCEEFKGAGFEPIRQKWEALSSNIGARVSFARGRETIEGEAIAMDQDGALVVKEDNGTIERILYGDVSLKTGSVAGS